MTEATATAAAAAAPKPNYSAEQRQVTMYLLMPCPRVYPSSLSNFVFFSFFPSSSSSWRKSVTATAAEATAISGPLTPIFLLIFFFSHFLIISLVEKENKQKSKQQFNRDREINRCHFSLKEKKILISFWL